ncbi:hypothetical protein BS47DRAFT_1369026 [Hydnum rufescens UP504]|uniref:Uncharacterized protein n=1 Tax=Hydnum rufescens UP504 TaxID=1448309 RepID=A0A9P6AE04_9AGAM|nr:hypothetical protein BS47DRAFT_1369026 [Hydnum rufescens UP504]
MVMWSWSCGRGCALLLLLLLLLLFCAVAVSLISPAYNPRNPRPKPNAWYKRVPHTHFCGCGTTRIQIKPPETTTHPNGHPSICKTEYKARDQGAKSVPHTRFSGLLSFVKTHPMSTQASPQYAQPPKPKGPPPETMIDEPVYHTPASAGVWFLPPVKTHLTSTWASPQYAQPPKQRGPAPRTRRSMKPRTTHPLRQALSQRENPRTTQPNPRTRDHSAKNEYHTPALAGVCLSSGPNTCDPPNEHGRTTTHPPNESHEWQRVETTMQAPDEPTPAEAGVVIFKVFF